MRNFRFIYLIFNVFLCCITAAQQIPCQTPDHQGIIIYEPAQWLLTVHGYGATEVQNLAHYGNESNSFYHWSAQTIAPNSTPLYDCNLEYFLFTLMPRNDIGILFINSHADPNGYSMEFHSTAASRDAAYRHYIDDLHIPEECLTVGTTPTTPFFYDIALTPAGIRQYCTNLGGALVFADGCSTVVFNSDWGAKIALGWDHDIDYYPAVAQTRFFLRLLGILNRDPNGNTNYCREVHDAAAISHEYLDASLICYPSDQSQCNIVLSPIVLEHQPGFYSEGEISIGSILFDCVMQPHLPASDLIDISGPPGIQVQRAYWDSDHELRFIFDSVVPDC